MIGFLIYNWDFTRIADDFKVELGTKLCKRMTEVVEKIVNKVL